MAKYTHTIHTPIGRRFDDMSVPDTHQRTRKARRAAAPFEADFLSFVLEHTDARVFEGGARQRSALHHIANAGRKRQHVRAHGIEFPVWHLDEAIAAAQ